MTHSPAPYAAPPPPRSSGGGRQWILLVAAVLALVVAIGGGAAALVLTSGGSEEGGKGGKDSQQRVELTLASGLSALGEPTGQWRVGADDLVPGGSFGPLRTWEGAYGPELLAFPGATVVAASDDEGTTALAALANDDGKVVWRRDVGSATCFSVAEDTRLLCRLSKASADEGVDAQAAYELIDPTTGETLGRFQAPGGDDNVDSDRDWIYLATPGGGQDGSVQLAKLSTRDLEPAWVERGEDPATREDEPNEFDAGMFVALASGDVQIGYGYREWTFDAASGDPTGRSDLGDGDGTDDYSLDGYRVLQDYDAGTTTVGDGEGNPLVVAPGGLWDSDDGDTVGNGRVGVGSSLYDLATGKALWTADGITYDDPDSGETVPSVSWSPSYDQLLATTDRSDDATGTGRTSITLLDAATGEQRWTREGSDAFGATVWTGDALVDVDGTTLSVRGREGSGDAAWSTDLGDLTAGATDDASYTIGTTDTAIVAVGDGAVRGFHGFAPTEDAAALAADGQDGGDGGTEYVTACGSQPELTPVQTQAANGGITVTFEVHAVCPGGGWLGSSGQVVRLVGADGASYASAVFDFSAAPIQLPGPDEDPVTVDLAFTYDTTYATLQELDEAVRARRVLVECETEPGATDGTVPASGSAGDGDTATAPTGPSTVGGDPEEDALAALRRIAGEDADDLGGLEGSWVPQLSSKKQGTSDDGIVYDYQAILAEHLRLRTRYPDARLVNSDDVGSFLVRGYWVTVVGRPSPDSDPALAWCSDKGFDADHCYAKRLLRDGPAEGSARKLDEAGG